MEDLIVLLNAGVGILISVLIGRVPFLAQKFYSIPEDWRGLSMVGIVLVVAAAIFGLSCSTLFNFVSCSEQGLVDLLKAFLIMIATNQITYQISPTSPTKLRLEKSNLEALDTK